MRTTGRSDDDLSRIRNQPILEVARRLGIEVTGNSARCPYPDHDDRTPSFRIYPDTNSCWCHRCGKGGSVIDLVVLSQAVTVGEAIKWLRGNFTSAPGPAQGRHPPRATDRVPTRRASPSADFAASGPIYRALLDRCPIDDRTIEYLLGRGFSRQTIAHFEIGTIANSRTIARELIAEFGRDAVHRSGLLRAGPPRLFMQEPSAVFPFFVLGELVYLQSRVLPGMDGPRWLGPQGIPKPVFNFDVISQAQSVYICEGVTDVLAAHQLGYSAIGLLGGTSGMPPQAIQALRGRQIYIVPDRDDVGEAMVTRTKAQLRRVGLSATVKRLDVGADVSENLALKRRLK